MSSKKSEHPVWKYNISFAALYKINDSMRELFNHFYDNLEKREMEVLENYKGCSYIIYNNLLRDMKIKNIPLSDIINEYERYITENCFKKKKMVTHQEFTEIMDKISVRQLTDNYMSTLVEEINTLDAIFEKAPVNNVNFRLPILYRGLYPNKNNLLEQIEVGGEYIMKSFVSSSITPAVAFDFQGCGSEGPCCIFVLRIKKKLPFIFLPNLYNKDYTSGLSEHEILLPKNTKWILKKKYIATPSVFLFKCQYKDIKDKNPVTIYEFEFLSVEKTKVKLDKRYKNGRLSIDVNANILEISHTRKKTDKILKTVSNKENMHQLERTRRL